MRQHETAPTYPWLVVGAGYDGWKVVNAITGLTCSKIYPTHDEAEALAIALKNWEDQP